VGGSVADAAIARGTRPLGVRRALAATGLGGAALCLLSLPGASSTEVALGVACATAGFIGLAAAGFTAVPLDITPRHAPMLIGFSNTLATIPGIIAVALTGWQLDATHNYASTFVLSAAVAAAGALLLAASARARVPEL
jgi:MFS transporter, ACS family, solute carrier family 17 (sodium-dependent inorganic phosphate cotransporter), other